MAAQPLAVVVVPLEALRLEALPLEVVAARLEAEPLEALPLALHPLEVVAEPLAVQVELASKWRIPLALAWVVQQLVSKLEALLLLALLLGAAGRLEAGQA